MSSHIRSLTAVLLLAACSSGGGGDPAPTRGERAEELQDRLENDFVSEPAQLPKRGTADYRGFMTARLPLGPDGARRAYIADLSLSVDFAAPKDQVSGRAQNFEAGDDRLGGRLAIRGGDLIRSTDPDDNYTFEARANGTLSKGATDYAVDAAISGEFRGRGETGVSGVLYGDITGPDDWQDVFDGTVHAERQ